MNHGYFHHCASTSSLELPFKYLMGKVTKRSCGPFDLQTSYDFKRNFCVPMVFSISSSYTSFSGQKVGYFQGHSAGEPREPLSAARRWKFLNTRVPTLRRAGKGTTSRRGTLSTGPVSNEQHAKMGKGLISKHIVLLLL